MRLGAIAAVIFVFATAISGHAEARTYYAHRHGCYGLHYDYSHSSLLSPFGFVYPIANWGPFFQCRLYYSPLLLDRPVLYW
jgi:hypothetical protein